MKIILGYVFTVILVGCSSPGLSQFGPIQKLPLENGHFVSYVLNGSNSCFDSKVKDGEIYTIYYGNLDYLIYGLSERNEKWKFHFDPSDGSRVLVTPLMDKIEYEEATCSYHPLGLFRTDFDELFVSVRFKKKF